MSISTEEVDAILDRIEDTDIWTYKIERLTKALEAQYDKGVQEGMRLAALFSSGGLVGQVSPNSFAMSKASDDNTDNSDDLYVNA